MFKREPQVWNVYDLEWHLLETYYLEESNIISKELEGVKFNLDFDLSEIFKDTLKSLLV